MKSPVMEAGIEGVGGAEAAKASMGAEHNAEEQGHSENQQETKKVDSKPVEVKVKVQQVEEKRPKRFLDLIPEIQALIVSFVIRPTDLKNLCLTCHHLHEVTVRQLYREVTLEVGSPTDTKLTAFINPRNKGVKHIRKMDLYLADQIDKCNQIHQANFAIRMILEFLPENILEKFSWHPWSPFSSDNLILLYKKQQKMTWLEGISLDRNVLPELEHIPPFTQNVRKLGLYPDSRDVLEFCGMLMRKTINPRKITLHASFEDENTGASTAISSRELNDTSTGPGLLTRTIFGHLMPFDKCKPLHLKDFTLQKINLRYAATTYAQFIDFRSISALRVFGCSGADSLFAELSKSQKLPEKLETLEFKHEDNPENDGLIALDGFLCLVSGIKVLTLDVCYAKTLPASAGIIRHGKTLREVNVHGSRGDGEEEEMVYELDDFLQICKACPGIEQLSMAFPNTSLIRPNSDAFSAFERASTELKKLVTLNITTWPTNAPSTSRLPRKTYEILLQSLAQSLFTRAVPFPTPPPTSILSTSPFNAIPPPPRLSPYLAVIAFGSSDKVYDREDSKNQIIYVKGRQYDMFGVESPLAVQIGWCLRKFVEKRSGVLDFALARSCRPPTREVPVSEDSE
ncbi:hypothetical protein EJ08DRAFT_640854 [Tothia fuscella]|uniref:Uncharacterized protein n=1 Tax=Tothia fuscella TaxID=1048955 RepID=A0A9P4TUN2_9PEZI|nr:hypothetical protein EJ08DRAFT_640854 [Tothia fuscella]